MWMLIAGILAAIAVPRFEETGHPDPPRSLPSLLLTIRAQIAIYNSQNPTSPYDATTPVGVAFWDPLVQNYYLQAAPGNVLQDNSTLVAASPKNGAGWVWAEGPPTAGHAGTFTIYAIDQDGNLFDRDKDGRPD
ncbi:MAG: hypothetical protein O7E49_08790 [Gemmatimonadetes bacterium]|nr:hypothetical protein [Gemmatimonadota bacterium]